MAQVEYRNVNKSFDKVQVIKDLNLLIQDKEFVVLVGPSGCGKTTTLRMLAGLETISSGNVLIDDRIVNDVSPRNRDIAMVFQSYALYPHMNVFDNMAFGLKLRKLPKEEIKKRVREAAEILDLTEYLKRKPRQLSGGQRQRVAVGRAIVRDPAVFLMDEPLSNLDAKLRVQARSEINALQRRLEATVVYVTHDQVEAMTMGHRIAVFNEGVLHQVDKPTVVYEHPADTFVAQFIGSPSMNLYKTPTLNEGGDFFVKLRETNLKMSAKYNEQLKAHSAGEITFGIRPEHIYVAGQASKGVTETATVKLKLAQVEVLGRESYLFFDVAEGTQLTAAVEGVLTTDVGAEVELVFDMSKIHLFDSVTGKAIEV